MILVLKGVPRRETRKRKAAAGEEKASLLCDQPSKTKKKKPEAVLPQTAVVEEEGEVVGAPDGPLFKTTPTAPRKQEAEAGEE